jgi:hypothetical protein
MVHGGGASLPAATTLANSKGSRIIASRLHGSTRPDYSVYRSDSGAA